MFGSTDSERFTLYLAHYLNVEAAGPNCEWVSVAELDSLFGPGTAASR